MFCFPGLCGQILIFTDIFHHQVSWKRWEAGEGAHFAFVENLKYAYNASGQSLRTLLQDWWCFSLPWRNLRQIVSSPALLLDVTADCPPVESTRTDSPALCTVKLSWQCAKPRLSGQKIVHFILYLIPFLCRLPNWKGLQQMDHWQSCRDRLIKWCPLGLHSGIWNFTAGFSLHRNMEDINELVSLLPVNVTKKYIHLWKYMFKSSFVNCKKILY